MLNSLLFCPKKEWNPHSNGLFFSSYELWGANIKFTPNSIKANNGISWKKNIGLDIYDLNIIRANILTRFNHNSGV